MKTPLSKVAPLLFASGLCALVYQSAWLRELRLVFGASTAASAAVLALFMAGLGAGGLWLGKRADTRASPLGLYGDLELAVAAFAAITPPLVGAVRAVYTRLGGTVTLGFVPGTILRLALAAVVLLPPTLLMGGTLPAAAKAVETRDDAGRRNLAVLYGVNTLGAVTGAALSTFFLLEQLGARRMLWLACALNAVIAVTARVLAPGLASASAADRGTAAEDTEDAGDPSPAPPRFVLAASAIVGFAFFLMELVWYRMLAPLLGGSSYTFGLILAIALLGVGLGGAAYAAWREDRPATMRGLALTLVAEALAIALPFALGDRLAILAGGLRPLGVLGFGGLVAGWAVVAAIVVLPAAFVSGVQFPLLIALLGRGDRGVGKHVGLAYAWNTAGAIAGSLAGGFGLVPLLGALGVWRLVAALLGALGLAAGAIALREDRRARTIALVAAPAALAAAFLFARGPTAAWRHSGIGAGRATELLDASTPNLLEEWTRGERRAIAWEADGVESAGALNARRGYAFVVNGKIDGHATIDAGTQVMSGLLGALLHEDPRRAFVVGLGTGSTAGWLGMVPSMERVDVVELEPAIVNVARACAPVNQRVLDNPKVTLHIGDGREVLLTSASRYDVIFSEPSNPYRAGVASLFTADFYRAAEARLAPGGLFLQWLQAYEVDAETVRTAYATIVSVFPEVETWTSESGDLILVASREPRPIDVPRVRQRVAEEPYKSALEKAWRVNDLEGVLAHFLAGAAFAREIARREKGAINTDDRNLLEFGFARSVGQKQGLTNDELLKLTRARREDRPELRGGAVDPRLVDERRVADEAASGRSAELLPGAPRDAKSRARAFQRWAARDLPAALAAWREQSREPATSLELAMIGEALASAGSEEAVPVIERLRAFEPTEAEALLAMLRFHQGKGPDALLAVEAALASYEKDPWPREELMRTLLNDVASPLASDKATAGLLTLSLSRPFAVRMLDEDRKRARLRLAARGDFKAVCRDALAELEPWPPWDEEMLALRHQCYAETGDARAAAAARDLETFRRREPRRIGDGFGAL
jgi:spermidine synthase